MDQATALVYRQGRSCWPSRVTAMHFRSYPRIFTVHDETDTTCLLAAHEFIQRITATRRDTPSVLPFIRINLRNVGVRRRTAGSDEQTWGLGIRIALIPRGCRTEWSVKMNCIHGNDRFFADTRRGCFSGLLIWQAEMMGVS